jgi:hypothetical protein
VVEGARLESVCTSKGYRGFESRSLRKILTQYVDVVERLFYTFASLKLLTI